MGVNEWKSGMDSDQVKYMDKLVGATADSDQSEKVLIFPFCDDTPVK